MPAENLSQIYMAQSATAKTTDSIMVVPCTDTEEAAPVVLPGVCDVPLLLLLLLEEWGDPELLVEVDLPPVELLLFDADEVVGRLFPAGQVKLKRAVVKRSLVMANLTSFAGLASRRVYQKTFFLPKSAQPTSCQYEPAFSTVAWAAPKEGPLYAQPVSVIQTSLPPATPSVAEIALLRRAPALAILLSCSAS